MMNQQKNAISLARVQASSLVGETQAWNLVKHRLSWKMLIRYCCIWMFLIATGCSNEKSYLIKFNSVDQLREGDFVYSAGTNIGKVKSIQLVNRSPFVAVEFSTKYQPCKNDTISILPVGVFGERIIVIGHLNQCIDASPQDTLLGVNNIERNRDVKLVDSILKKFGKNEQKVGE